MNKKIAFLMGIIVIFFINSGCSAKRVKEYLVTGEGKFWSVEYKLDDITEVNKHDGVTLTFSYMGSLNEITRVKRIVFSYGTSQGSAVETINFDNGVDKAVLPIQFKSNLFSEIVGKSEEEVLVTVKWSGKEDTFRLEQFSK